MIPRSYVVDNFAGCQHASCVELASTSLRTSPVSATFQASIVGVQSGACAFGLPWSRLCAERWPRKFTLA